MKKKQGIALALAAAILVGGLCGCRSYGADAAEYRKAAPQTAYTAYPDAGGDAEPSAADAELLDGYETVCETACLRLYAHEATAAVAVLDRRSGKMWYSNTPALEKDSILGADSLPLYRAQLTVQYVDGQNEKTLNSYSASVSRGEYTLTRRADGLDVEYRFADDRTDEGVAAGTELFRFTLSYTLSGESLIAELPMEKVVYSGGIQPLEVTVLPHFGGSAGKDGYLLLPDGSGVLVDFSVPKAMAASTYVGRVYGPDFSLDITNKPAQMQPVALPVFGIRHEGHAFLAIIEDGEALASVRGTAAGSYSSYNEVCASFTTHASQTVKLGDTGGNSRVLSIQNAAYGGSLRLRYSFMDEADADYSGMARYYRRYLIANGLLPEKGAAPYSLQLELLGAVDKRKSFLGFQYTGMEPLTDTQQAQSILQELSDSGVSHIQLRYSGWFNGGLDQQLPSSIHVESAVGGAKGFRALESYCRDQGVTLFADVRLLTANARSGGLSRFRMVARQIDQNNAKAYTYSTVTQKNSAYRFILKPAAAAGFLERFTKRTQKLSLSALALQEIGTTVYADYTKESVLDRQSVVTLYNGMLQNAADVYENLLFDGGNQYVLSAADQLSRVALSGSGYAIADRSVPFYSMVVHGSVGYAGMPLNMSADPETDWLRCVEYGGQPIFLLMAADGSALKNTEYDTYCSSHYATWRDTVISMYDRAASVLAPVQDSAMIRHETMANEVYRTTYANGCAVYVNYGAEEATVAGVTVPARSAKLVKGGETA